ncbi:MAG: tRNA (N6-threonylcarbamoyladenosine(37)-N6)-methyltransferase TrmO [Candidatus Sericytochromatia bacterium]
MEMLIKPIGFLHSDKKERYEAPRQGIHAKGSYGVIKLNPYCNFEQAVQDLEGFDRIWLIYGFHLNDWWKPLVSPPRFRERKVGLFATRSPFRPNQLGMSCVKLEKVNKLKIYISEFDLLDQTPIYDIKPYIPYCDSFPESKTGWLKPNLDLYNIVLSDISKTKSDWLAEHCNFNIENYARVQLQVDPLNDSRRRIHKTNRIDEKTNQLIHTLNFRTWRLDYISLEELKQVFVIDVYSSYSGDELKEGTIDKKGDKDLHRLYRNKFQ